MPEDVDKTVRSIFLTPYIATLLYEGFQCAGDGGIDPFTAEQRAEVETAIDPYRRLLVQIQEAMKSEEVHAARRAERDRMISRRASLMVEIEAINRQLGIE